MEDRLFFHGNLAIHGQVL